MADWTEQDVNSLLPGEPWTSAKSLAAFENPIAIAKGAVGAPGVMGTGFARDHPTDVAKRLPPVTVSASNNQGLSAGIPRTFFSGDISGATEQDVAIYTNYSYNGVVRFNVFTGVVGTKTWRIYVNDVFASSSTSGGHNFDRPISVGDVIRITLQVPGGAATATTAAKANRGYVPQSAYILSSDI